MRILVVEDQPIEMKLAVLVLSAEGHEVRRADTAESALAEIERARPDVVLLDLSLPGMDGLALARALKSNPETRGVPIVAITSYPEKFPASAAADAGCDAYLHKPVSTRLLPSLLSEAAEKTEGLDTP